MADSGDPPASAEVDDVPRITCSRCDRAWRLEHELEELRLGNRAVEKFALDHRQHTGHFPDDVTPWLVDCRHCPDGEVFLSERPARRWAATHARHTGHSLAVRHGETPPSASIVSPEE